jgi:hypothetical protein
MRVELQAVYDAADKGDHGEAERILRTLDLGTVRRFNETLRIAKSMASKQSRRNQRND